MSDLLQGKRNIHFIGVGGIGMSALAKFLCGLGYEVSGSDSRDGKYVEGLSNRGIRVFVGHDPKNLDERRVDLVVYSSAIHKDNPEFEHALSLGIPMVHRAQLLANLMNGKKSIGILGTHGKTTTSSMVSFLMERLDFRPTCFVGGVMRNRGDNVIAGEEKWIVAEVDESDGSHLLFSPKYVIITNIEEDHLDYYADLDAIKNRFREFLRNLKPDSTVIYSADCPNLRELVRGIPQRTVPYGFGEGSEFTARDVFLSGMNSSYELVKNGENACDVVLGIPGRHNVSNSLAAIALLSELGQSLPDAVKYLRDFSGTKRRLEIKYDGKGLMVFDDYAHHPTEVRASLSALKAFGRSITCVFQPHRYSRVASFAKSFGSAFQDADEVIVTGIYGAGESNVNSVDSSLIYNEMRRAGHPHVLQMKKEEVIHYLLGHRHGGDIVAFLGAGDITEVADNFVKNLPEDMKN